MGRHTSNQSHFAQVPRANIPRSSFNRSQNVKLTMDAGLLVPVFVDEVLPGDTFNLKEHLFGRLATPIKPIMDNLYLDTFYFFVPNRLVFENWQKMNGEQENPNDSTDFLVPQVEAPENGWQSQSMADYFGIPTGVDNFSVNSLHFRAYNLIYNEWFRDQNLQQSLPVPKDDGPDDPDDFVLKRRGKRHDYFTSCLPFPQKGPAVELPLGLSAPVYGNTLSENGTEGFHLWQTNNLATSQPVANSVYIDGSQNFRMAGLSNQSSFNLASKEQYDPIVTDATPPYADLSEATAATINQLREAFQIQKLYERDARGGTRYTEIIRSHFGVISPDARLQRPEYLGGGSTPLNITPIAQTSESGLASEEPTPQGNLAAMGTVATNGKGFVKSFTEHGVIIGLACVRADLNYQQGLHKMWTRQTRFDFYWPSFAHLGEQAVLNKEIYLQGTDDDEKVFGYQERYAEYRYKPNQICGKFRSSDPQSLDLWHLAQDFESLPALNASFIEENPPMDRVIAVQDEPDLILDGYFSLKCARPMPVYSVPGLIDHF